MSLSVFGERAVIPNEKMVATVLCKKYSLWNEIKEYMNTIYPPIGEDWKYYSKSSSWSWF